MSKIKTFRGLLPNSSTERVRLTHRDGRTGYKIKKFQILAETPMQGNTEFVMQIFSISPDSPSSTVNFSDNTLLAVATASDSAGWGGNLPQSNTVFDNVVVSQDIYITNKNSAGTDACNFYLELEQSDLDDNEATATILKNFRNTNSYS